MHRAVVRKLVEHAFADQSAGEFEHHVERFAEGAVLRVHAPDGTHVYAGAGQLLAACAA
jgi:hypothetical protein